MAPGIRQIARPLHGKVLELELEAHRRLDRLVGGPPSSAEALSEVTAVVKTFERPRALLRCLESIRRLHPGLKVIVVDDSRVPSPAPGAEVVRLPFDSGVSAGRQAGLDAVSTSRVLMMDDDFVFYRGTDLLHAMQALDAEPAIDIVGGVCVHLPMHNVNDYRRFGRLSPWREPLRPLGSEVAGLPVRSKTTGFWVGRTESVRRIGWDPVLKRVEHHDFFRRCFGRLLVVEDERFRVLHANTPFDDEYMAYRTDFAADLKAIGERLDL